MPFENIKEGEHKEQRNWPYSLHREREQVRR